MKLAIAILAAAAVVPAWADDGRVRAQEPSVVTVKAKQPEVETRKASKRGKVWSRVASAPGWLLNAGDDIPAGRESKGFRK